MSDFLRDRLPGLFQRKESPRQGKTMSVLGEYNLGNIIAFSSEFSDQARDMMISAGELRAGRIVEAFKKGAPNPNKHHMVPLVSIIKRGDQHFLRYMQEWRNEVDQPDVALTTAGNEVPITRRRAKEIMRKFSQFNEFELRK
jgi:hypothetical protein